MIRINKNLFIFTGLILLLGVSSFVFLQKLLPLVSHVTYYCQTFINSLSLPIPYYFGIIPFLLFFVFLFIATIKLFIIFVKVQLLRKNLLKKSKLHTNLQLILEKLQLSDKTNLIESDKQFAFCLGVRSPKIYISTKLVNLLTIQELEAVLHHERYHLDNRDTLTLLIASIGESLLPFFPLFSDFLRNYRIEREIQADAVAIRRLGNKAPVIAVLKKLLVIPSMQLAVASAIADQDTLEPRILALIKKDFHFRKFRMRHIFISAVSVLIMSIISFAPVQAVEVHHQGEDVVMICPQNNECLNSCKQEYSINKKIYSENVLYSTNK